MSKLLTRIQALGQKAAQLKQAVDAAPAKAAQLRDAVNATAGQLQQLRSDVQDTVTSLHADTDNSLAETLVELDKSAHTLERAGYQLTGVDIEQGKGARVIVHLDQISAARSTPLPTLIEENAGKRTISAILKALVRAEELEEQVSLGDLSFRGLIVHIGPVPVVRICWRRAGHAFEVEEEREAATPPPPIIAPPPVPPPLAGFGAPSFFGSPAATTVAQPQSSTPAATPIPKPVELPPPIAPTRSSIRLSTSPISRSQPATPVPSAATGDDSADPLARFKQMPRLTK